MEALAAKRFKRPETKPGFFFPLIAQIIADGESVLIRAIRG